MPYKKILISNRAGIGDTVLTTPVLKALREKFPDSKLTLMISDYALPIVDGLPFVDEIIAYNKKRHSVLSVVKQIWKYDLALCLDFKYRTALMAYLARIPIRAGLRHKRKFFMTNPVERDLNYEMIYEPYNYSNIIKNSTGITLEGDLSRLHIGPVDEKDRIYADHLLQKHAISSARGFIAIAPFTSWAPKNWPLNYYNELIQRFKTKNPSYEIVLIGEAGDVTKADAITGAVNFLGQTTLKQMAEIIRRSSLFIGGCSGPIHIAAAVDTPIVGIYGPTSAKHWAPVKKSIILAQYEKCSPCDGRISFCDKGTCLKAITVDKVYEACNEQFAKNYL